MDTIRANEPRELLALIPYQLGFVPSESLVMVSLRGATGRVGLILRTDLAGVTNVAPELITHLVRDGADQSGIVIYTHDDPRPTLAKDGNPAVYEAIKAVKAAAVDHFDTLPVWAVTSTGYLRLDCTDPDCCPRGGRPMSDLQSTNVAATLVSIGTTYAPSRGDALALPRADETATRSATAAARRWTARNTDAGDDAGAREAWRVKSLAAWRTGLAQGRNVTPATLGRIAAGLNDPRVRDAVLITFTPDGDNAADASVTGPVVSFEASQALRQAFNHVTSPVDGTAPDARALDAHVWLLEQVAAHATVKNQVPALTLLGMLAWWAGDTARGSGLTKKAMEIDSTYPLARLIHEAATAGVAPGWVRRDQATPTGRVQQR